MTTWLKAVSVSTCISLAALAASAVVSPAQAEVHIFLADLNLQTPQGQAQFNARVDAVAHQICLGTERLRDATHSACLQAVRDEAKENLAHEMERIAHQGGEVKVASARH